jgi:hypothetical protein
MTLKLHPLPDKSQRRILIFIEAECDSTGSGFFVLNFVEKGLRVRVRQNVKCSILNVQ